MINQSKKNIVCFILFCLFIVNQNNFLFSADKKIIDQQVTAEKSESNNTEKKTKKTAEPKEKKSKDSKENKQKESAEKQSFPQTFKNFFINTGANIKHFFIKITKKKENEDKIQNNIKIEKFVQAKNHLNKGFSKQFIFDLTDAAEEYSNAFLAAYYIYTNLEPFVPVRKNLNISNIKLPDSVYEENVFVGAHKELKDAMDSFVFGKYSHAYDALGNFLIIVKSQLVLISGFQYQIDKGNIYLFDDIPQRIQEYIDNPHPDKINLKEPEYGTLNKYTLEKLIRNGNYEAVTISYLNLLLQEIIYTVNQIDKISEKIAETPADSDQLKYYKEMQEQLIRFLQIERRNLSARKKIIDDLKKDIKSIKNSQ